MLILDFVIQSFSDLSWVIQLFTEYQHIINTRPIFLQVLYFRYRYILVPARQ